MQDVEFTIERGKLWMLQTRAGKRTAEALRIAVDLAEDGDAARGRDASIRRLHQLLHPTPTRGEKAS
jgi:pyruvate,orthophosphate dikinase